ncbi:MAG: MBL fold metallo-hydrolase [Devosia sp.]
MTRLRTINRRTFGLAGASTLALAPGSLAAAAQSPVDRARNFATYHFAVGDIGATVVSDGQIAFPAWPTYAPDVDEGEVFAAMQRRAITPPDYLLDTNVLVLDTGSHRILVDTGWGAFAPQVGGLASRLRTHNIEPEDIDLILLTHLHPDHVGGLTIADGDPAFPRADIVVPHAELGQWRDTPDFGAMTVGDAFKEVFVAATKRVFALGSRVRTVAPGEEIVEGVSFSALPGHTVGHAGVRVESGSDALIHAGDTFHDQAFDLDHPSWRTAFDHDPVEAERTRRALLDGAAADGSLLMAYHMPFPGIGRISRTASAYIWQPARWRLNP